MSKLEICFKLDGNAFQYLGPLTEKALSPYDDLVLSGRSKRFMSGSGRELIKYDGAFL